MASQLAVESGNATSYEAVPTKVAKQMDADRDHFRAIRSPGAGADRSERTHSSVRVRSKSTSRGVSTAIKLKIGLGRAGKNGDPNAKKQQIKVTIDENNLFTKHILLRTRAKESKNKTTLRGRICRFCESHEVTTVLNALLIIDLTILIASMQVELYYKDSQIDAFATAQADGAAELKSYGDHGLHDAEVYLMWSSVSILAVFLGELLLLMFGMGQEFFTKPMEMLDLLVVMLSLYFELARESFAATVLLLSRTWRFVRFMHGLFELEDDEDDEDGEGDNDKGIDKDKDKDGDKDEEAVKSLDQE